MMKKVLAFVLVLTLVLGMLPATAMAAKTTDPEEINYQVGYSKVDINPYWSIWESTLDANGEYHTIPTLTGYKAQNGDPIGSDHIMPLPMGGYGGNTSRLSRPELVDDTGTGADDLDDTTSHADGHVYLDNNRYTYDFAVEMLGSEEAAEAYGAAGGFGQNDGDGIYATCVSIRQNASAEPILYFSVDFIGMADSYCGNAKILITNALKEIGVNISPERIMINATHTHGSVSLGESYGSGPYVQELYDGTEVTHSGNDLGDYLNVYKKHLYAQLAVAAVKAVQDGQNGQKVTMSKGSIDVSEATGYQLNGVRHSKATVAAKINGVTKQVQYVTGSSFNVSLRNAAASSQTNTKQYASATKTEAVSESDDKMHVLQFSFPEESGIKPVLMVNWRAHTTPNNKMGSKAYNNLSADFVAPMRWRLEQWGYRPILIYGASGNLGTGDTPTTYNLSIKDNPSEPAMSANQYGYELAYAAAFLANSEQPEVQAFRQDKLDALNNQSAPYTGASTITAQGLWGELYDKVASCQSPGLEECEQGTILLESTYYNVQAQTSSNDGYAAALYHHALAKSQGKSDAGVGGLQLDATTPYPYVVTKNSPAITSKTESTAEDGTKTVTFTHVTYEKKWKTQTVYNADGTIKTDDNGVKMENVKVADSEVNYNVTEDGFVIASQYHAKSLISRHGKVNTKRIGLTTFTLGSKVAFATVPFEASDRYSVLADLTNANDYNDWNNLATNSKTNAEESWGTPFVASLVNGTEGYIPNHFAYTYQGLMDLDGDGTMDPCNLEPYAIANKDDNNTATTYVYNSSDKKYYAAGFVNGCYEAHIAYAAQDEGEKIVAKLDDMLEKLGTESYTPQTKKAVCQACGTAETWTALDDHLAETWGNTLPTGHYYVAENSKFGKNGQMSIYLGQNVCVDLNGQELYFDSVAGGRSFSVYGVLNIMDLTESKAGKLMTNGYEDESGGNIRVGNPGVLNLYSGTLTTQTDATKAAGEEIYQTTGGGNVYVEYGATFNMFGGTIENGRAKKYGGNVQVQHGVMNMYGGTVQNGTGDCAGKNILISGVGSDTGLPAGTLRYVNGKVESGTHLMGSVILGDPNVVATEPTGAALALKNNGTVTLDGVFTGRVTLTLKSTPTSGSVIGAVTEGSRIDYLNGAKIALSQLATKEAVVDGTDLKVGTASVEAECEACDDTVTWYPVDDGSTSAKTSGHYFLRTDYSGSAAAIASGSTLCLDLHGHTYRSSGRAFNVSGTLNILDNAAGGKLQGTSTTTSNGGTIYVYKAGVANQYGGELTCNYTSDKRPASGGVVFVAGGGTYNLYDGAIKDGQAANYGGNVTAQDQDATFNMYGGTVSGGSTTGTTKGSENIMISGSSTFRYAGGDISTGGVFMQGTMLLGSLEEITVDTSKSATIAVKNQGTLKLSGTFAGKVNLDYSGSKKYLNLTNGSVIGEVETGAQIDSENGAEIKVVDAAKNLYVTVVGSDIKLIEKTVTNVEIVEYPAKTTYSKGEALETNGLKLKVYYSDGTDATVTSGFEPTGYNAEQVGEQTVTVTYQGHPVTFTVTVKKELESIRIEEPTKKEYKVGEAQDLDGLKVWAYYNDGTEVDVTAEATISGFDSTTAGVKTLTVTYQGKTATFTVTVNVMDAAASVNGTLYAELSAAINASSEAYPVVLMKDVDTLTLSKNLYLDLNGHHVTAVSNNQFKLYCMDSVTDDFSATSGWGTAPKQTNVVALNDYRQVTDFYDLTDAYQGFTNTKYYLALDENDGKQSFHRIEMLIHSFTINTRTRGISYTASFQGDAKIRDNIKEFGIAMRAYNAPNETYIWADSAQKVHVARTAEYWNTDALRGVDVTGILTDTVNDPQNAERANVKIYGSCYIQFTDGTMLFSPQLGLNMHDVKRNVDAVWNGFEPEDQALLTEFFEKYSDVFGAAN